MRCASHARINKLVRAQWSMCRLHCRRLLSNINESIRRTLCRFQSNHSWHLHGAPTAKFSAGSTTYIPPPINSRLCSMDATYWTRLLFFCLSAAVTTVNGNPPAAGKRSWALISTYYFRLVVDNLQSGHMRIGYYWDSASGKSNLMNLSDFSAEFNNYCPTTQSCQSNSWCSY